MSIVKRFKQLTEEVGNVVITTHIVPDADGIGSAVALCLALKAVKKKVVCVNEATLPNRYNYLDRGAVTISADKFSEQHKNFKIDLLIVVDTNSLDRIGPKMQKLASKAKNLLFIDHHPCSKEVAAIHCIDLKAAATGEIVGNLIDTLGVEVTKEMALALYTAILIDTSSFRYPTVTGDTLRLAAKLLDVGIDTSSAYNSIYGLRKLGHLQMLGAILSDAKCNKAGSISWLEITGRELKKYGVKMEDTFGFINHLLVLNNVQVACMFFQSGSKVKVSLRSSGKVSVGIMAQALGGGGHDHSGATVIESKDFEKTVKDTVNKIEVMLKETEAAKTC